MADRSDQLEEHIHRLKASLVAVTRGEGSDLSEPEFREIRKLLFGNPKLRTHVPAWLKTASTLVEANRLIRTEADQRAGGKWANRAALISEGLNPLLDELEQERAEFEASGALGERLGGGGFGEVYRWHHKLLDMDFAIKVLSPAFPSESGPYLERFFREARILLTLNHPNVVRVYDVGMHGRRPYIRMELLTGLDLNGVLRDKGSLDPTVSARVAHGVAEGLSHAHDHGIVHRDIKPSNVFWTVDDRICVINFGLGAFVEGDLVSRITKTGERAVGGLFSAPELVADPRRLDTRSDVYSTGAVWFTVLTGRPPAGASVEAQLDAIPHLSPDYRAVLRRSLAEETIRYANARELSTAIKPLLK